MVGDYFDHREVSQPPRRWRDIGELRVMLAWLARCSRNCQLRLFGRNLLDHPVDPSLDSGNIGRIVSTILSGEIDPPIVDFQKVRRTFFTPIKKHRPRAGNWASLVRLSQIQVDRMSNRVPAFWFL